MADFQSIFVSATSQSSLEDKLNDELDTLVISSMASSSLVHAEDGSNKAGLVFAVGTGEKLQVKLFSESSIDNLQQSMSGWINGQNKDLVQLAINYGDNQIRAMLIYKSLVDEDGYSVAAFSTNQGDNMETKVNTAMEDVSEVISDSTYGGGNYRTVLITK